MHDITADRPSLPSPSPAPLPERVTDRRVVGKRKEEGDARCEDVVVLTGAYAAVIDGATGKGTLGWTYAGQTVTSGRFAALVLAAAIEALPPDLDGIEAVGLLTVALRQAIATQHRGLEPADRPTASVVMYSASRRQVWRVGDGHFAIDGIEDLGGKLIDRVAIQIRQRVYGLLTDAGVAPVTTAGTCLARYAIEPLLKAQGHLANVEGGLGFAVLDGQDVPEAMIEVVDVPAGARAVTLASDGYLTLAGGLDAAESDLASRLGADPHCVADGVLAGTKPLLEGNVSFDDRAWLTLDLAG